MFHLERKSKIVNSRNIINLFKMLILTNLIGVFDFSDTEVEVYFVVDDGASTVNDLDTVMQFLPQQELYDILAKTDYGDPTQQYIGKFT